MPGALIGSPVENAEGSALAAQALLLAAPQQHLAIAEGVAQPSWIPRPAEVHQCHAAVA